MRDRFERLIRPCEPNIGHVSVCSNSSETGLLRVRTDHSSAKAAGVSS